MPKIINNVVSKETMRKIQSKTLNELSEFLRHSFGPNGSTTCIKKENALSRYTKDGHTIIGSIHYNGIIEQSIKDDVESITRHIVKTVGDGTTSAVILSALIFDAIVDIETKYPEYSPNDIIGTFSKQVEQIKNAIQSTAKELTVEDVYDIAMISTNGNEYVSGVLRDIYKEYGNSVFIDVSPSTGEEFVIKSYNGMTLNTGYCDSCYVTNAKNNTSEVDHPEVYFFEHPIDTRELGVYLDAIISRNIIAPVNAQKYDEIIPTVIFAPTISQDVSSTMDALTSTMASMPVENKLPICVITDYTDVEELTDLAQMCGAKLIRKYIDPKIYQSDVELGKAPTPETIYNWAGTCDRVVAYSDKTTFIRPSKMYNKDGTYSNLYNNLLNFLETEVRRAVKDGDNINEAGKLKRRLHSLKSNMVELFVGGITQADRDSLRDLVEDAVLNLRSAGEYGVGFGANMSAAVAVHYNYLDYSENESDLDAIIAEDIEDAYSKLTDILYNGTAMWDDENYDSPYSCAVEHAETGSVYNIRTKKWSSDVKSSIRSDITILDTVTKIIGIMATCNQFILPTAMHNIYEDGEPTANVTVLHS